MNRQKQAMLAIGLLTAAALSLTGCYNSPGECPGEEDATRVVMEEGVFSANRSAGHIDEDARPHPDEEVYVRVSSDDTVEVLYERDDEVIVETYQVTDRAIEIGYY